MPDFDLLALVRNILLAILRHTILTLPLPDTYKQTLSRVEHLFCESTGTPCNTADMKHLNAAPTDVFHDVLVDTGFCDFSSYDSGNCTQPPRRAPVPTPPSPSHRAPVHLSATPNFQLIPTPDFGLVAASIPEPPPQARHDRRPLQQVTRQPTDVPAHSITQLVASLVLILVLVSLWRAATTLLQHTLRRAFLAFCDHDERDGDAALSHEEVLVAISGCGPLVGPHAPSHSLFPLFPAPDADDSPQRGRPARTSPEAEVTAPGGGHSEAAELPRKKPARNGRRGKQLKKRREREAREAEQRAAGVPPEDSSATQQPQGRRGGRVPVRQHPAAAGRGTVNAGAGAGPSGTWTGVQRPRTLLPLGFVEDDFPPLPVPCVPLKHFDCRMSYALVTAITPPSATAVVYHHADPPSSVGGPTGTAPTAEVDDEPPRFKWSAASRSYEELVPRSRWAEWTVDLVDVVSWRPARRGR